MERERLELKREIIKELIFDRLYRCIELDNDGIANFDKYNLDCADMLYMIKQYDPEKFETVEDILRSGKHE